RLEQHGAKHQIGFVADGETGRITGRQLAGIVQLLDCFLLSTVLQQRDAEVVSDKASQVLATSQLLEHLDSLARLARCHQNIRAQKLDVIDYLRRDRTLDPLQSVHRVIKLTLLEVDTCEPKRSLVSYGFIDGALEDCLHSSSCAQVHAVIEFE